MTFPKSARWAAMLAILGVGLITLLGACGEATIVAPTETATPTPSPAPAAPTPGPTSPPALPTDSTPATGVTTPAVAPTTETTPAATTASTPEPRKATTVAPSDVVVSLTPNKDNTLYGDRAGNISNGAGQHLFAGATG